MHGGSSSSESGEEDYNSIIRMSLLSMRKAGAWTVLGGGEPMTQAATAIVYILAVLPAIPRLAAFHNCLKMLKFER
jgi:hypothetical protein